MQSKLFADQPAGVFLGLPVSARAGGMADCFTALADDPFGAYYNPAGISFIRYPAASFSYQEYLVDTNGTFAAIAVPGRNFSMSIAPGFVTMQEEPIYDSLWNDTGKKFKFQATIVPVSGAYRIGGFSLGASAKYYKEEIADEAQDVSTFDAGIIYKFKNISFGASWLNMNGKLWDYDLPGTIKYGAACKIMKTNLLFDYNSQINIRKDSYNLGGEVALYEALFIRFGYKLKDEFGGLSYGLGIKIGKFDIDYASSNYSELGVTQRVALNCRFSGEKAEEPVKRKEEKVSRVKKLEKGSRIAVCEFKAENTSQASVSMLRRAIFNELSSNRKFETLSKENMETALTKKGFKSTGCTNDECAVRMGKALKVKVVLTGSLSKTEDTYHIKISLVEVKTGEVMQSIAQDATLATLLQACKQIVERIE